MFIFRTVPADTVNKWAYCLLDCIQEMGERLQQQSRAVQSVARSVRSGGLTNIALQGKTEALELKLLEAKEKASSTEKQRSLLGYLFSSHIAVVQ